MSRKERDVVASAVAPQALLRYLCPLSSRPRNYRKMACLPTAPLALALRRWLGIGLFVLLCLSLGKQEMLMWEHSRGCAGRSTRIWVGRGWLPPGHLLWCLLPGQGVGWLAVLTMATSTEVPRALSSPSQSHLWVPRAWSPIPLQ